MSGIEIAGLALGLLPVLSLAVKGYGKYFGRPLSRYRKLSKELDHFLIKLDNQQAFFLIQCEELLSAAVGTHEAQLMLSNDMHQFWSSEEVGQQIASLLGEHWEPCVNTIRQIEEIVRKIRKDRDTLAQAYARDKGDLKKQRPSIAQRKEKLGAKVKFAFSNSQLEENLITLKDLTTDFRTFCFLKLGKSRECEVHSNASLRPHINKVQDYRATGRASQEVFDALRKACDKHIEHQAHLCVDIGHSSLSSVAEVEFTLAFTNVKLGGELRWFAVRLSLNAFNIPGDPEDDSDTVCSARKRPRVRTWEPQPVPKRTRQVRIAMRTTPHPTESSTKRLRGYSAPETYINGNLCDFLREWQQYTTGTVSHIGILKNEDGWRSTIHPVRLASGIKNGSPISLRSVILLISHKDTLRILTIYQRLRLARVLVVAFLRYHPTEWGHACWESENIHFFDADDVDPDQPIRLTSPHLNARICGPDISSPQGNIKKAIIKGARNPSLFNLGLLLIEIAYSAEWETLKEQHSSPINRHGDYEEFDIAARLAKTRSSGMPGVYHDAIDKLIACDFAHGDDLKNEDLQAAVHRDVVSPLQKIEESLVELKMND